MRKHKGATAALALMAGIAAGVAAYPYPALAASYWGEPKCDFYEATGRVVCAISQAMTNQQTLSFAFVRERDGGVFAKVGISDVAWSMPDRDGLPATVSIDARAPIEVVARTSGQLVAFALTSQNFVALERAQVLHVALPSFSESYDLTGSRRAIDSLITAYNAYIGAGRRSSDPFAGAQPQTAPASDPFTPVVRRRA